jgi:DNA-binding transcriptional MerR regulator
MRIGELAGLVGISTRAIRHYHRVGLLAEPARKANGYREYSLRDAVELARVRRLTELGLSLDEVGDALVGDAGRDLVEILRELDADLARQEADLRRRRARLAQLLRQAEAGGMPSEQAPVSPGLAGLFDRMAHVAAGRPGPESAMAAKDRDLMALLETASPACGTGWLDMLTRTLSSDPTAVERAYAVYARLDELAGSPADHPRVEATAQAIVAAVPEPARQAIRFPDGDLEETGGGLAAAFYADFAPAQAAAIRRAVDLMRESHRAGGPPTPQPPSPRAGPASPGRGAPREDGQETAS